MQSQTTMPDPIAARSPQVPDATNSPDSMQAWVERSFIAFLAACAAYMLYFSTWKLLDFDEMLSYFTESLPNSRALLLVQSRTPVSLDPPLFHLLGHWVLQLGLNPAMSVRLPSLLGSLIMMAAVYLFARRLAGNYTAAIAIAGLIVADNFHMVEARPYGILFGATGLSLLLWQNAVRGKMRTVSLLGLFLALGLATSCHYFGILAALPFLLVECARLWQRRKLDIPLTAAVLGSYIFGIAWLPFLKAAHQYKTNYYIKVHFSDLFRAYTSPFDTALKIQSPWIDAVLAIIVVFAIVAGAYLGFKNSPPSETGREEWTLVFLLALLPIAGVMLAAAASGAFETRYVVEFSIGLSVSISSLILHFARARPLRATILVVCCLMIVQRFSSAARDSKRQAEVVAQCYGHLDPGVPIVIDDDDDLVRLHYYHKSIDGNTSPPIWVADMDREVAFSGSDNIDRTMLNLRQFTDLPVTTYNEFTQNHRTFELIADSTTVPPNWIESQLRKDGGEFTPTFKTGALTFYTVRLPAKPQ